MWQFLMFKQMPLQGKSVEDEDLQLLRNSLNSNVQLHPALQSGVTEYQLAFKSMS
ncbi:hypothetical protein DPMN_103247 [Dreissena polymorpha]|uniref:Uncharacterized protein n=1 Tax=Dreissena polymorpha TaxID=45954 RepID=A0A9D4HE15_DREPO|nr:hypothetical protein DPMN_103247 [Dreissena polymorpha]